ncbi:MAG: Txe/YoeB family addiction module toxin [Saprospiraceae bacterium]
MGKYYVDVKETAKKDIQRIFRSGDKITIRKLEKIIQELAEHPYSGSGNPELLKYTLFGYWSRRLNKKDRLIYQIIEEPDQLVVIVSALGHY